ncbi:MAG TPA: hypothetical protein VF698_13530 [Thermoanaerobaculia bacterium]|jgi:hypothetical protein
MQSEETFRHADRRSAESSQGFSVRLATTWRLEYREGDRLMLFSVEPTGSGHAAQIILYGPDTRPTQWAPPHDSEPVDAARQHTIVANIVRALQSLKLTVNVDPSAYR